MAADTIEVFTDLDRPPLTGPRGGRLFASDPRWRIEVVAATGSTNADLVSAVRAGTAADGDVLVAEEQHAGRGRLDRSWVSPPRAGLTFSVVLAADPSPWMPLLIGVALARAVQQVAAVPALLKWPNDLIVHDRKLAGLLAEVAGPGLVVVGIGLNVSTRAGELPPGATSLALEGAAVTDRKPVLLAVLRALAASPAPGPSDYRALCATLGRRVSVQLTAGEAVRGIADLDGSGRLVVDGRAFSAGDVVHLRPDPTDGEHRGG